MNTATALASLIPWAAYLGATAVAYVWVGYSFSPVGLLSAGPLYLPFVALPSLLLLAVARHRATKIVVLVVMTATAVLAAVLVVTTEDGQAGLAVFLVSYVAIPLFAVIWVGQAVIPRIAKRGPEGQPRVLVDAEPSDRLRALVIDGVIAGAALVVPVTALSDAHYEVAAAVSGVVAATAYLGGSIAWRARTVGQSLLGLSVVDAKSFSRVGPIRAFARSLIVVLEVLGAATIILLPPAVAEIVSTLLTKRSLTDRLLRTTVLASR